MAKKRRNNENRVCKFCKYYFKNDEYQFCGSSISDFYREYVYPDDKCNCFCKKQKLYGKLKRKKQFLKKKKMEESCSIEKKQ